MWDKKTLYQDHPIFGVGMSGNRRLDIFEDREEYGPRNVYTYPLADYSHAIELIPIWW